ELLSWLLPPMVAAAAALLIVSAVEPSLPSATLSPATPVTLRAADGFHARVALREPSTRDAVAQLELRGPALLEYEPAPTDRLRLDHGYARVAVARALHVSAGDLAIEMGADADCAIELLREGGPEMSKRWLIPVTAVAAAGGVLVGVLAYRGH